MHKLRLQPTLHSWYWHLAHERIAHANFYVNDASIDYVVCIEWSFYSEFVLYNFFLLLTRCWQRYWYILLCLYIQKENESFLIMVIAWFPAFSCLLNFAKTQAGIYRIIISINFAYADKTPILVTNKYCLWWSNCPNNKSIIIQRNAQVDQ